MRKKVVVLMSTYNGEKFIEEQIKSLIKQQDVDIKILVRDDGSTDNTINILKKFKDENVLDFYVGKNKKPAKSFMELLSKSPDADYYAFCDQDDYWMPNKLSNAIQKLEQSKSKNGKFYYSSLDVVDKNLNFCYNSTISGKVQYDNEMIKNYATGCTIVIDYILRNKVNNCKFDFIAMHDSWIYRIALSTDAYVYYDKNSYIKYRQHENNVLGTTNNFFKIWNRRLKRFIHSISETSNTARELLNNDEILNIPNDKKNKLIILANYKHNFKYKLLLIFTNIVKGKYFITNFLFKIKVLFNRG